MAQFGTDVEEDLVVMDVKLKQLKNEFDQYFLGTRKREPYLLKNEVAKMMTLYANIRIQNTGHRFKFNNLRARYFSLKRHWDLTLRKIEEGRYERHVFKANLREREASSAVASQPGREPVAGAKAGEGGLFDDYLAARLACGQGTKGVTKDKLDALLAKQERAIREKTGCAEVRFRVVVEGGKTKLKASPVRG